MIRYRPATMEDAVWLAPRLRPEDAAEVIASSGLLPSLAVRMSVAASTLAVAGEVDGEVAGLFGVTPADALRGEAVVWMLGTPASVRHARAWLRDAPQWLTLLGDGWRVLRNRVDARNVAHLRWLRRMGFTVEEATPWGARGLPFHPVWRSVESHGQAAAA